MKTAQTLKDFIQVNYEGNQAAFATANGVKPQQVTQWISKGFIVADYMLYSPRRELAFNVGKVEDMDVSIENFKRFVLNNDSSLVENYCEQLAQKLNISDDKLGDLLTDEFGTFYCPDCLMATRFGFADERDMLEDIKALADENDRDYHEQSQALHDSAECFDNGFYGSGEIIFVNLTELAS